MWPRENFFEKHFGKLRHDDIQQGADIELIQLGEIQPRDFAAKLCAQIGAKESSALADDVVENEELIRIR